MLILAENGLSAQNFGQNDRSPVVSPSFCSAATNSIGTTIQRDASPDARTGSRAERRSLALEVREHAVDPIEDFMRRHVSDRHRLVVLEPLVAGPAVRRGPGSKRGRASDERLQRRSGLVHNPAELGAPGLDVTAK